MKEIKFRIWQESSHCMYYDGFCLYSNGNPDLIIQKQEGYKILLGGNHSLTLMQYTGLKDKNDKEIYEGDIVRGLIDFGPGGEHEQMYEVKISPFGVNIPEWNYTENHLPEIIGNIYENPELLEKQNAIN